MIPFYFIIVLQASNTVHAENDKSEYCPTLSQIHYDGFREILRAYNSDGNLFNSGGYCGYPPCYVDGVNKKVVSFKPEKTSYIDSLKQLNCVYLIDIYVYDRFIMNKEETLFNYYDY